jgi:FixJ family two-component response regulator
MSDLIDVPVVHLVEDDEQVAKALARLLREHGLPTAMHASAEAYLAQRDPSAAACLVLDVHLPGLDGLALQRRLAVDGLPPPIVFLTGHGDIPMSVRAIKAGAIDFLTKPVDAATLVEAVRTALAEDLRARRARAGIEALRQRHASLTPREREVLAMLATGRLNKQIAADLGIAEPTVKFHRARIMERMQARTVAELMHQVARLEGPPSATEDSPGADVAVTPRA